MTKLGKTQVDGRKENGAKKARLERFHLFFIVGLL
jgi:hypothetical protein